MERGAAVWTPSSDGYTRQHEDKVWTAAEKIEQLISETVAQRAWHCDDPAADIVEEVKLKKILDRWKDDYKQWMRPETLKKSWWDSEQGWHQTLRKAWRSHLFQMVGCFEMVIYFIVVPFNNDHLLVFKHFANEVAGEVMSDRKRNRRILDLSKDYVRACHT